MRILLMFYCFFALCLPARAQRMIPGQKGLELNAGLLGQPVGDNYSLNLMMVVYGRNGRYRFWGLAYGRRSVTYKSEKIPLETFALTGGFSYPLVADPRKFITFNLGLAGVLGYESINRGDTLLYDGAGLLDKSHFVYGAEGRLSLELYLSDRFVWLFRGYGQALWGTDLNHFRPAVGSGLRFNF